MNKVSVFCGLSLDGFIARIDGGLDWLEGPPGSKPHPDDGDFGFSSFFARIDALVLGRATYDILLGLNAWHYGTTPVFVLTHRPLERTPSIPDTVEAIRGAPRDVVEALAARGHKRLYIDGGRTIQDFLAAGLVDELILTRLPVLIGMGIPLFGDVPKDMWWTHRVTRTFKSGLVQSEYERRSADV